MINNTIKYSFGAKLREIRGKKGITLKEVAQKADLSESLISQIERNKVSPSIDTLLTIIDILEIDMDYVFKDYRKEKLVKVVKANDRKKLSTSGIIYEQLSVLADEADKHAIEAFLLEIAPGHERGNKEYGHAGRELGFIIEGQGEFYFGENVYQLDEGDSITFSSGIPHILKNTGEKGLKALWMITPPKMLFFKD